MSTLGTPFGGEAPPPPQTTSGAGPGGINPLLPQTPSGAVIESAKGTILKFSNVSTPPTFANVSQVRSITGPTVKPKIVDVTTHDTPGFWARKMTVLVEGGDLSFEINWSPIDATHAWTTGMWNSMAQLALCQFQMTFPNGFGTMTFKGYVSQHEFTVPVDNVLAAKIQLAITDNITTALP